MGLVNAVYSWGSVKALHCTVLSMNLAGLVALAVAIVWAIRFERGFGDYLNLITPGDGHIWATVIISAAVLCSPAYVLGIKSWLYLKMETPRSDLEDQQKVDVTVDPHEANRLLFFHVVACLVSGFLVAILNATYLVLLSSFQQKSRDGLIEAIQKYGSDVAMKARVDAVQTELECCGDSSYEDWSRVPWLKLSMEGPEEEEEGPQLEGQPASEDREEEPSTSMDVPFSCCSNDIPKPCIHHDILNPSAVYDYNPKQLTITTLGCRSKIISRGRIIRTFLAGYLALLSVYQVVLSFFARLLQTAHSNDLYIGPRKPRYHVWIVFRPDDLPYHEQRSEESHPRKQQFNQNAPSSSTSSSSTEEEIDVPVKHRRHKTSSLKVLNKIRSKISTVRAKSLPLLKSSRLFSKSRSKKRHVHPSEDEDEGETTRRLLPDQRINSEVFSREDHGSDSSSSEDSSMADLPPPPPPPPPFLVTLDVENEEGDAASVHSRHSTVETNIKDAFKDNIIATQNSGRRVKVLEKFAKIWERSNRVAQHRERGGADCSSSELSSRSNRSIRVQLNSTDVYNRFRGSLQHTLARRETVQARRVLRTASSMNMEARRSNLLARLRCNEVPPSYRLIANLEDQRRPGLQVHAVPPSAPPPPLSIPSTRGSAPASQRQRHCSICNRPVQHSRTSSSESLIDRGDARRFSVPRGTEGTRSRGDYLPCHRSTLVSKSVRRS